jgi:hypothetical protein
MSMYTVERRVEGHGWVYDGDQYGFHPTRPKGCGPACVPATLIIHERKREPTLVEEVRAFLERVPLGDMPEIAALRAAFAREEAKEGK